MRSRYRPASLKRPLGIAALSTALLLVSAGTALAQDDDTTTAGISPLTTTTSTTVGVITTTGAGLYLTTSRRNQSQQRTPPTNNNIDPERQRRRRERRNQQTTLMIHNEAPALQATLLHASDEMLLPLAELFMVGAEDQAHFLDVLRAHREELLPMMDADRIDAARAEVLLSHIEGLMASDARLSKHVHDILLWEIS